ncbi:MAG: tryptophan--tRNA ligase [Deltaproteobacteria bacterium]|nr:tryptophan--tRNA ligase [Deltaproteobacteria bacterium]
MRILSGIQSSGRLHLGNYYGAIRQWVRYQDQGDAYYFIADLHSLTSVKDPKARLEFTKDAVLTLLSFGIDPARAAVFVQSHVPEVTELYWILGTLVPLANLERAHSYKDKIARGMNPDFGLFAYPVLMTADILLYDADVVPVGKDQVQHIEFARDWATKFNVTYVPGYDPQDPTGKEKGHAPGLLKLPEARLEEATAVVPGVDGQKMSKSYGNTVDLFGEDKDVKKKIMSIRTDSTPVEAPKPTADAPLYDLLKLMAPTPADFAEVERAWREGGRGYGDFKKKLLEWFHAQLDGPRARRQELLGDWGHVERVLADGAQRARATATPVLQAVKRAAGL